MYSSEYQYGVTPDVWGKSLASSAVSADWPVILEIKTGVISDWVGLQTAAQAMALINRGYIKDYPTRYGIQLNDDGTYKMRLFSDENDYDDWGYLAQTHVIYEAVNSLASKYKKGGNGWKG
jgi:hypothetical protein